jgi:CHAP domain
MHEPPPLPPPAIARANFVRRARGAKRAEPRIFSKIGQPTYEGGNHVTKTQWYEQPYKGGPMAIPASYFPRPLYPPDAAPGHAPSADGPDVLAYKRTLSRLQRWTPWDPSLWDDTFSNAVSHGRGTGNVGDSGVAGFQRQMNITPDTGFIGKTTFNALASARVPDGAGSPHAGEMAMDANACNLIAEAFEIYGGAAPTPPPPASTRTTRERALAAALTHVGYAESPANSNNTKFGEWYGMNYQPWCAMFVTHCFEIGAGGSPSFARAENYSYVPYVVNDAKANRRGLSVASNPLPGDLVCFDWQYDGVPDHIGIFETGTPGSFQCVEGNTSTSDNSNGGQVMRRTRSTSDAKITFVRVAEP